MDEKAKIRLVLDTNQDISAFGWRGLPHRLYRECVAGEYQLFISPPILNELEQVMRYPKSNFAEIQVAAFMEEVLLTAALVDTGAITFDLVKDDPDDNRFLECAVACDADFLITGDDHLLDIQQIGYTGIVTVRAFYQVLSNI